MVIGNYNRTARITISRFPHAYYMSGREFIDMTGQTFGRFTVTARAADHINPSGRRRVMWHVRCDCGNETDVNGESLRYGRSTSCGCSRKIDNPTYVTAHYRVRQAKGKASDYPCVDECGRQAQEWSYDRLDPEEVWGTHGALHAAYSYKVEHYVPRCAKCHNIFDGNPLVSGWKS